MSLNFFYNLTALQVNSHICLYGAGSGGIQFKKILDKLRSDIKVVAFIDTFKTGVIEDVPILKPNGLKDLKGKYDSIVITSLFVNEIYKKIQSINPQCHVFYYTSLSTLTRKPLSDVQDFCVIYANCQGKTLLDMLHQSPSFAAQYTTVNFYNYTPQQPTKDILTRCKLFIYQDVPGIQGLMKALPPNSKTVCLPKISWRVFWPFTPSSNKELRKYPYSDAYVLDLIRQGHAKEQVVKQYMQLDVHKHVDLKLIYQQNIDYLNSPHNTRDIRITDYIVANFKKRELFFSYNHPHKDIALQVTNEILNRTGRQSLKPADVENLPSWGVDFQMPIHPSIADFFGLEFYTPDTTVNQFGEQVDFCRYIQNYVDSEMIATTSRHDYKKGTL